MSRSKRYSPRAENARKDPLLNDTGKGYLMLPNEMLTASTRAQKSDSASTLSRHLPALNARTSHNWPLQSALFTVVTEAVEVPIVGRPAGARRAGVPLAASSGLRHDHVMGTSEPWWLRRPAVAGLMVALAAAGFAVVFAIQGIVISAASSSVIAVLALGPAASLARCYPVVGARFAGLTPRPRTGRRQVAWHVSFAA